MEKYLKHVAYCFVMVVIIVSGTPGTGKTVVAKAIAKALNYGYVDVKRLIRKWKLSECYDSKRKCLVVDEKKLSKKLEELIKNSKEDLVIDSHLSHFVNPKFVDVCIITKTDLKILEKRLKSRKYSKQKIRDNLDSEIFDVCFEEAKSLGHKIIVISTTKRLNIRALLSGLDSYGIRFSGNRIK